MPGSASNRFDQWLASRRLELRRGRTEVLQLNVGKLCNQTCTHCHVNAGPGRKEVIARETLDRILEWLEATTIPTVDITGGAPELIPDFRYLVGRLKARSPSRHVIDRCNLTVLLEPGQEDLAGFLAEHRVEIIASLPCYSPGNVDEQRGEGVFDRSIRALQRLNRLGYGTREDLPLNLVYNPNGAFLPGDQAGLEADYKSELGSRFGIVFHRLLTLTNMPIERFAAQLRRRGEYETYLDLLAGSANPATVPGLMCRSTINVDWLGFVHDCDFNQMLALPWRNGHPLRLWELPAGGVEGRAIETGDHCFGCTAGCGSSCGGALTDRAMGLPTAAFPAMIPPSSPP